MEDDKNRPNVGQYLPAKNSKENSEDLSVTKSNQRRIKGKSRNRKDQHYHQNNVEMVGNRS